MRTLPAYSTPKAPTGYMSITSILAEMPTVDISDLAPIVQKRVSDQEKELAHISRQLKAEVDEHDFFCDGCQTTKPKQLGYGDDYLCGDCWAETTTIND